MDQETTLKLRNFALGSDFYGAELSPSQKNIPGSRVRDPTAFGLWDFRIAWISACYLSPALHFFLSGKVNYNYLIYPCLTIVCEEQITCNFSSQFSLVRESKRNTSKNDIQTFLNREILDFHLKLELNEAFGESWEEMWVFWKWEESEFIAIKGHTVVGY